MATPKKVVIPREVRDKVLREAILDESKVRVSLNGIRRDKPANPPTSR